MTDAIILAGGRGTRLAPYSTILPKPLMPIGDKPILEIVVRQLARHGFRDITLAVGHMAELLMAYFGDGQRFGVSLKYSREEQPLGTAGPLGMIDDLAERVLVMNGDVLTGLDYSRMASVHAASGAIGTIATNPRQVNIDFGVIEHDARQHLTAYIEKPTLDYRVSMGIYFFERRVQEFIKRGERLDLPDLVKQLVSAGETMNCHPHDGYWLDIGRPDDYQRAVAEFTERESDFLPT
jgi:NDP-sugar pyrophosphorylase family protein